MRRDFHEFADPQVEDLREKWVFRYKPSEVLAAAEKQVKHHIERAKWWEAEADKAEGLLKKKGFEYRSHHNSLGEEIKIVGDPELAQRVAECKEKFQRHQQEQKLFETWTRALKAKTERQPGEELELKIGDVVFFGL